DRNVTGVQTCALPTWIDRISLDLPAETTDDARLEQELTEALREASTAARKAPAHRVQDHPDISAVLGLGKDSAAPGPAPHHRERSEERRVGNDARARW